MASYSMPLDNSGTTADMNSHPNNYLETLNDTQKEAVETIQGPVLILAGAGTGKTRVLTTRIVHILSSGVALPHQILAVTFTNKAANEMRNRVETLLRTPTEGLWIGTFHALAARILRNYSECIGLSPDFTILDMDDQLRLLKQLLQAENIDEKKLPPRTLNAMIQRWKDRGLTPSKVPASELNSFHGEKVLDLYFQYQERLKTLNSVDFGDLLLHNLDIFAKEPDVLQRYQNQFKFLLVDEYQDTNIAQYLWLRILARTNDTMTNICCVGDEDQSIYGWRGAEIGNILKFEKDFPGAKIIRLEQNYRSTSNILKTASHLISHNQSRLGKTLWTSGDEGEKVTVKSCWDGEEEARYIGDVIEDQQRKGSRLSEIAILVRASFQTREFEERLLKIGVPYIVIGGPRFYERQEIRDALAYLRIVFQPHDDLALERIINVPKRGIGTAALRDLHELAKEQSLPLFKAAEIWVKTGNTKTVAKKGLSQLLDDFNRWKDLLETEDHVELAKIILDESGYTRMWQESKNIDAPTRLENLKELVSAMSEFENLRGFLEHVSLVMEVAENATDDKVYIMTLHAAKGLEFDTVLLPGWEESLFPHQRSIDETGVSGLEEERRLAYVGLTRAKKQAYISFASRRRRYNYWQDSIPSRFIDELPQETIHFENASGFYSGSYSNAYPQKSYFGGDNKSYIKDVDYDDQEKPYNPFAQVSYSPKSDFKLGDMVHHPKFGKGRIVAVKGDRVDVSFDGLGIKTILSKFISRA